MVLRDSSSLARASSRRRLIVRADGLPCRPLREDDSRRAFWTALLPKRDYLVLLQSRPEAQAISELSPNDFLVFEKRRKLDFQQRRNPRAIRREDAR